MSLLIGQVLEGFCGGAFGRVSYDDKRVEAIGVDWIIVRYENGEVDFATGNSIHEILSEFVKKDEL